MPKYGSTNTTTVLTGGMQQTSIAAAAAAANITGARQYNGFLVDTAGTAELAIYHGTSTSGTLIDVIVASATRGTRHDCGYDCPNGVFINSGTNTPKVTIYYSA